MKRVINLSLDNEDGEIWVPFVGYEGIYEISNHGRVKRLMGYRAKKDRILRCSVHHFGYLLVTFSVNDIHDRRIVHIEVAKIFVPNPNNYPQVCHLDNNGSNPRSDNLKWGTQSHNIRDAHEQNRMGGEKHGMSVLSLSDVNKIRTLLNSELSMRNIARMFNVTIGCISSIKYGKTWRNVI